MLEKGSKVGIVCCSNGLQTSKKEQMDRLCAVLRKTGLEPVLGEYLYAGRSAFSGTAVQRAGVLMDFYREKEIRAIFDVSGGDMANELLPLLDYGVIADSGKQFWGYSDLTTIINGIYTRTGRASILYQVRNLLYEHGEEQQKDFEATVLCGEEKLFDFPYRFVQGECLSGTVVGGNIRCFLKLAGTPYWPDLTDKILLLEAMGGGIPQMVTYLSQLEQLGAFQKVRGILLGTFSQMEKEMCVPDMEELVRNYAGANMCIVKTDRIGHGTDSKGIAIGRTLCLQR